MNAVYRMQLINIHNYFKSLSEPERINNQETALDYLRVISISMAKDYNKVVDDYLKISKEN